MIDSMINVDDLFHVGDLVDDSVDDLIDDSIDDSTDYLINDLISLIKSMCWHT